MPDSLVKDRIHRVRAEILLQLYGARPTRKTLGGIHRECVLRRDDFTATEIEREAAYLSDKGLVRCVNTPLGDWYEITATGIDFYLGNYAA
jgi:hypothetical protein